LTEGLKNVTIAAVFMLLVWLLIKPADPKVYGTLLGSVLVLGVFCCFRMKRDLTAIKDCLLSVPLPTQQEKEKQSPLPTPATIVNGRVKGFGCCGSH